MADVLANRHAWRALNNASDEKCIEALLIVRGMHTLIVRRSSCSDAEWVLATSANIWEANQGPRSGGGLHRYFAGDDFATFKTLVAVARRADNVDPATLHNVHSRWPYPRADGVLNVANLFVEHVINISE